MTGITIVSVISDAVRIGTYRVRHVLFPKKGGSYDVDFELGRMCKNSVVNSVFSRLKEYDQETAGEILSFVQGRLLR